MQDDYLLLFHLLWFPNRNVQGEFVVDDAALCGQEEVEMAGFILCGDNLESGFSFLLLNQ